MAVTVGLAARVALGAGELGPDFVVVQNADLAVEVDGGDWSYALVPIVRQGGGDKSGPSS